MTNLGAHPAGSEGTPRKALIEKSAGIKNPLGDIGASANQLDGQNLESQVSDRLEYEEVGVDPDEEAVLSDSDEDQIKEGTKEVIKLLNVHKTYLLGLEGVPALRGVNLTINDGEFITILGTSGGGKTTMLNIIGTIDKPSKGDVYICGLR